MLTNTRKRMADYLYETFYGEEVDEKIAEELADEAIWALTRMTASEMIELVNRWLEDADVFDSDEFFDRVNSNNC